jgi:hypothetical protein
MKHGLIMCIILNVLVRNVRLEYVVICLNVTKAKASLFRSPFGGTGKKMKGKVKQ